jgi:hypothetical protein
MNIDVMRQSSFVNYVLPVSIYREHSAACQFAVRFIASEVNYILECARGPNA